MTECPTATAPPVAILLSTCNGAAFLPELLASLRAQTHRAWRLCWRDDGSADASPAVLAEFAAAEPRCDPVPAAPGLPMGAGPSFLALLRAVLRIDGHRVASRRGASFTVSVPASDFGIGRDRLQLAVSVSGRHLLSRTRIFVRRFSRCAPQPLFTG